MQIKNWSAMKEYEHLKAGKTNGHIWTWEFLRRNKEYQTDWLKFCDLKQEYQSLYGDLWYKHPDTKIYTPSRKQEESVHEWSCRVLDTTIHEPIILQLEEYYCDKWHIKGRCFHNPLIDLNKECIFREFQKYPSEIKYPFETKKFTVFDEISDALDEFSFLSEAEIMADKLIFVFDLQSSKLKQFEKAQQVFEERAVRLKEKNILETQKKTHNNIQMLIVYLRLLDTRIIENKPSWIDIAANIYPNLENLHPDYPVTDRLKKNLRKANKLTKSPYTLLNK